MTNGELKQVIRDSLGVDESDKTTLDESYVAQTKKFHIPTENLSTETKDVHYELYEHYVSRLNYVSAKLDTVDRRESDGTHSEFRSLKIDEIFNLNAVYLHELFFANVGDAFSEITMDTLTFMRLERDFGNFEHWQRDFVACGMAAREGWVVTAYSMFLKRFVNFVVDSHNQNVLLGCYPVIVVDMWAHSYYHDRMGDKKSYLLDMMRELNWNVIEERFKRAEIVAGALR